MKFLCDNCKAKYQIGDDKVAGKTVRMKCRRCGHLIQVNASVTESSVAHRAPTAPPPAGDGAVGSFHPAADDLVHAPLGSGLAAAARSASPARALEAVPAPEQAAPISGGWFGDGGDYLGMTVQVSVRRIDADQAAADADGPSGEP